MTILLIIIEPSEASQLKIDRFTFYTQDSPHGRASLLVLLVSVLCKSLKELVPRCLRQAFPRKRVQRYEEFRYHPNFLAEKSRKRNIVDVNQGKRGKHAEKTARTRHGLNASEKG